MLKFKRQDDIGINTLEEDNTNVSDNYGRGIMFLMIISILFLLEKSTTLT